MRKHLLFIVAALATLATLGAGASATLAARSNDVAYDYNGKLLAAPGATGSQLFVEVRGGNRPALRTMIGQSRDQLFKVDSSTQYIRWENGVPKVVSEDNLEAGDLLSIRVRADAKANLAQVENTAARAVSDRGDNRGHALKALWLFVGQLTAPAGGGKLHLHVTSGNWRALHAMLGQSLEQSYSYDAHTIFVLWQGRVPTLISASQLKVGDRISVRIRAEANASLGAVESKPASHVGDHEPALPH